MMRANKKEGSSGKAPAKQKVMAAILILVLAVIGWQIVGLFTGGGSSQPAITPAKNQPSASNDDAAAPSAAATTAQNNVPQPASLPKQSQPSPREMELMRLQAETQAKYIAAVNELQMLKIQRQLAETNQAIATAKLATVTAEKNIVDMLAPPAPPPAPVKPGNPVGPSAANDSSALGQIDAAASRQPALVPYTVISVSQANRKWSAVIGYQDQLYHVQSGDILPADNSVVMSIDNGGVWLSNKEGIKRRLSLVPII